MAQANGWRLTGVQTRCTPWEHTWRRSTSPNILNLDTTWTWVVALRPGCFTSRAQRIGGWKRVQEITHYNAATRTGPHKTIAPNVWGEKGMNGCVGTACARGTGKVVSVKTILHFDTTRRLASHPGHFIPKQRTLATRCSKCATFESRLRHRLSWCSSTFMTQIQKKKTPK